MIVKVLKPEYLINLRDRANELYSQKVHLVLAKAKEAVILKECDITSLSQKAPTQSVAYESWQRLLQTEYDALKKLKENRDRLQTDWNKKAYLKGGDYNQFIRKYEEEHYHPSEEDYYEVEVPDRKGRTGLLMAPKTPVATVLDPNLVEENQTAV